MKIAVASGKGGTGKTTLAIALALSLEEEETFLLDCDVEEPNIHLFLPFKDCENKAISILCPLIATDACTGCGLCVEQCMYNAIVKIKQKAMVFTELCHGCGACALICPEKAITEIEHHIGNLSTSQGNFLNLVQGCLDIGNPLAIPVIKAVKKAAPSKTPWIILDCPPGTSCSMIHSISGADAIILVTEPTPFGYHDLKLAVNTLKSFSNAFFGVIINRCNSGDESIINYCNKENIPILLQIPESRKIAEAYAQGSSLLEVMPEYKVILKSLLYDLKQKAGQAI